MTRLATEGTGTGASWSQRRQDVAAVLWPSFLAAAFASLLCFAFLDPALLEIWHTRMTGYAVGFFFFWLITAISSLTTLYLVRTARRTP